MIDGVGLSQNYTFEAGLTSKIFNPSLAVCTFYAPREIYFNYILRINDIYPRRGTPNSQI